MQATARHWLVSTIYWEGKMRRWFPLPSAQELQLALMTNKNLRYVVASPRGWTEPLPVSVMDHTFSIRKRSSWPASITCLQFFLCLSLFFDGNKTFSPYPRGEGSSEIRLTCVAEHFNRAPVSEWPVSTLWCIEKSVKGDGAIKAWLQQSCKCRGAFWTQISILQLITRH